jgi:sugar phosphate isomerase/epimerase
MQVIFFTKFLAGLSVEEVGKAVKDLGFDGLDLAIRNGQCVNPKNVTEVLPKALKYWKDMGLSVPMATLEANAVDPKDKEVEAIFEACGAAGIPYIKLGYWFWKPERHFEDGVENIRGALSVFKKMGEKYGVCSLVHTHSQAFYGSNASGAMILVKGFDPQYVGVYLDPAHLEMDGEPLPMALDMVRNYLKVIGVKNVRHERTPDGKKWRQWWCQLPEGLVDWAEALKVIKEAGFNGPLSVHGEYSFSEATDVVLKELVKEMEYLLPLIPKG